MKQRNFLRIHTHALTPTLKVIQDLIIKIGIQPVGRLTDACAETVYR